MSFFLTITKISSTPSPTQNLKRGGKRQFELTVKRKWTLWTEWTNVLKRQNRIGGASAASDTIFHKDTFYNLKCFTPHVIFGTKQ